MKINVHAGHNPDGKIGCGAVGILKESTETRKIKDEVISLLRMQGHIVHDCTVENGRNASDVLKKIVEKCNVNTVDLDVSIHLNGGRCDDKGDGKTGGTEVFIYSAKSGAAKYAEGIVDAIAALGYNKRSDNTYSYKGVKLWPELYFLRKTKAPAMLIECCFVDDADDVALYSYRDMAEAIVYGITGEEITREPETPAEDLRPEEGATSGDTRKLYRVQVGAYAVKDNAVRTAQALKAAGFDVFIVNS